MGRGLYREHGIVLRTWKLGEADRIANLLTRTNGKVRAVAKGARKARSRFGARVEPGMHLSLQLYAGRGELDTITQAESVDPMTATRGDLQRLGRAAVLLEVADHASLERQPNARLYHLLLGALRSLEQADRPLVVAGFVLKLLAQEGVQPDLEHCLGCGSVDDLVEFDASGGGVRCRRCRVGLPLSADALEVMRCVLAGRLREVIDLPDSEVTQAVEHLALVAVEHHLERRIRSAALVLDTVAALRAPVVAGPAPDPAARKV
jgi:DNA repair protein RecO (recombination protein O)